MIDHNHLAALAAIVRTGSFDRAARQLGVTPSAISQRVKLLEERLGTVLIIRGQPCTATAAGARLCRHAEEVALLEHGLRADLGAMVPAERPATLRLAVNADSLATWFIDAMALTDGLLFDLVLDDQDHSAEWLRRGEVSAAVSSDGGGVQGCGNRPLGGLRYVATASAAFFRRWFEAGVDAASLQRAPSLRFNAKDELQVRWASSLVGRPIDMPCHWLPASHAFVDAALAGLGWGVNPASLVARHLEDGRLVELAPGTHLDVPLFWQWSRAVEPALRDVTAAVLAAAGRGLVRGA